MAASSADDTEMLPNGMGSQEAVHEDPPGASTDTVSRDFQNLGLLDTEQSPDEHRTHEMFQLTGTEGAVGGCTCARNGPTTQPECYKFSDFASAHFQDNATHIHIRRHIGTPLLALENTGDQLAALAVWVTILRFMGDMPEPEAKTIDSKDTTPVMTRIYASLGRKFSERDLEDAMYVEPKHERFRDEQHDLKNTTSKTKHGIHKKLVAQLPFLRKKSKRTEEKAYTGCGNALLTDRLTSNTDKLHFIIGHGILRPDIRDEIYSQICKQLTHNPSKVSHARGWILLALTIGCFTPSDKFVKYLWVFLKEGPPNYAPYCEERLRRTFVNGTRNQPPSWLELQATKGKKPMLLPVTFMDGSTKTLVADSAITAKELCLELSEKISLTDQFGFSIYIALFDKVSSLGSGGDHVMDAVSQCEQYAKEQEGAQERNAPWRLFFRKEIFVPWHDSSEDPVATNLIYQQVVRGIKFGEYRCDKDEDLAIICAQQYYIDYSPSPEMVVERLQSLLQSYIPDSSLQGAESLNYWLQGVYNAFKKSYFVRDRVPPLKVKEEIVNYAKYKWPLLFSRFYEAYKFAGPSLPKNDVIIAVNWTGVYVVNDEEQVLLELSFPEITTVSNSRNHKSHGQCFSLSTIKGDDYIFTSPNAEDICDLVLTFLDGLKKRSRFLIAMQDYEAPGEGSSDLSFRRGDLIILAEKNDKNFEECECVYARIDRTGQQGDIPAECVYVLPTSTEPPTEVLELFKDRVPRQEMASAYPGERHTLEVYAQKHFRPPPKQKRSKVTSLWQFSKEPIKQPLLKKLTNEDGLSAMAVSCYLSILKYMGDGTHTDGLSRRELVHQIIEPALKQDALQDETYCQVLKQLTNNPNSKSEERGWEIMWLCTACFVPSNSLFNEVTLFLRSQQHHQIAVDSLNTLQKTLRDGCRKFPPHEVEVEAIQERCTQIFHKVYFPDDTDQTFEIDSRTKVNELCTDIANKLNLRCPEGFSLFIKIGDKVISVPGGEFFFDFLGHLTGWVKKVQASDVGVTSQVTSYQVFFMKNVWTKTVPGQDENADIIFHYNQELARYLRGYHKCTCQEALHLAALVYRAKHGDDTSQLDNIKTLMPKLVPVDLVESLRPSDLRKITDWYHLDTGKSPERAKTSFLKLVFEWPTFGSAFFEVKQTTNPDLPESALVAINKHGVSIIHPETKDSLVTNSFTRISNWRSGSTYFEITIGSSADEKRPEKRLLFETSHGYGMDDLLTSYIGDLLTSAHRSGKTLLVGPTDNFLLLDQNADETRSSEV